MSKRRKREYETGDYLVMLRRLIRRAGVRVADSDEIELGELMKLREALDAAIVVAMKGQRARGFSWAYVASATGVTRQAAQKRWAHRMETD